MKSMAMCVGAIGVAAALVASLPAWANVTSGSFSRTETWTVSPGGGTANWTWNVNWALDLANNRMTLSHTIRLNAASGSAPVTTAEMTAWKTQAEAKWNRNDITITRTHNPSGESKTFALRYEITFTTAAVANNYKVEVYDGAGGTGATRWYREGGSGVNVAGLNVVAHEVGHFLGCPDEYTDGGWISTNPPWNAHNAPAFTTHSLMNNTNKSAIPTAPVGVTWPRHYHAWVTAFREFDRLKGNEGYKYEIVPTPASVTLLVAAGVAALRRRRAA